MKNRLIFSLNIEFRANFILFKFRSRKRERLESPNSDQKEKKSKSLYRRPSNWDRGRKKAAKIRALATTTLSLYFNNDFQFIFHFTLQSNCVNETKKRKTTTFNTVTVNEKRWRNNNSSISSNISDHNIANHATNSSLHATEEQTSSY